MAKERLFNLMQTKGSYQLKGIVTGTEKDNFYSEKKTKNGKDMRIVNFGIEYDEGKTVYISFIGIEQEKVYFSKSEGVGKDRKFITEAVNWSDRFIFNKEGFGLIGNHIGVTKVIDEKGNEVNDKKVLTDYDSCKEIADNLKDGMSVFVKGNISYNSYTDDKGNKRVSINFNPTQVSRCADVKFNAENFETCNDFNQQIVFKNIELETDENGNKTGRYIVSAYIVNYGSIENTSYIINDSKLANMFKKNLKPYNAIKVNGHIIVDTKVEEVADEDEWGESDKMQRVASPTRRELVITGAKGSTLDKELYSESSFAEAFEKIKRANKAVEDFGDKVGNDKSEAVDDWGSFDDIVEDVPW